MELIKYNRPKLPRNKYGITTSAGAFRGSIVNSEGTLDIDYAYGGDKNQTPTTPTPQPTVQQLPIEWYNIQNKFVHSYTDGTTYKQQVDSWGEPMYDKDGEPIMVKNTQYLGMTWCTVIENYSYKLKDTNNYRFVLMRFRKGKREGKRWRIPWFSPKYWNVGDGVQGVKMDILERDCWWPIQGTESKWWNASQVAYTAADGTTAYRAKKFDDVLPVSGTHLTTKKRNRYLVNTDGSVVGVQSRLPAFRNTNSNKMVVGCAIFKKENSGVYGWQRVSNIATVVIRLSKQGNLVISPNVDK